MRRAGPPLGDHRGVDEILGYFAQTMEPTAGTFRVEFHDALANDEHTVAMYVARGEREGETLEGYERARQPCPQRQAH
jgi:hypothetical protein